MQCLSLSLDFISGQADEGFANAGTYLGRGDRRPQEVSPLQDGGSCAHGSVLSPKRTNLWLMWV